LINKKKRDYTRLGVQQSLLLPWKGKEKKTKKEKKRSYYNMGYSYLVIHPSRNPAEKGLTLLSERDVVL